MSRPQPLPERDAYVELVRLHDRLYHQLNGLFRGKGLTPSQFNVLRILRGANDHSGSCHYIGERLISAVPDVTRLVDRMQKSGLITRQRNPEDRRVVLVSLSPKGLQLCKELDEPVDNLHKEQFASLSRPDLDQFIGRVRGLLDVHDNENGKLG